jgi:hypothetical protein
MAYGFLFGFGGGKITHQFGEVLGPKKAAAFYGMMISFFTMALFIHVGLSAKKEARVRGRAWIIARLPLSPAYLS